MRPTRHRPVPRTSASCDTSSPSMICPRRHCPSMGMPTKIESARSPTGVVSGVISIVAGTKPPPERAPTMAALVGCGDWARTSRMTNSKNGRFWPAVPPGTKTGSGVGVGEGTPAVVGDAVGESVGAGSASPGAQPATSNAQIATIAPDAPRCRDAALTLVATTAFPASGRGHHDSRAKATAHRPASVPFGLRTRRPRASLRETSARSMMRVRNNSGWWSGGHRGPAGIREMRSRSGRLRRTPDCAVVPGLFG